MQFNNRINEQIRVPNVRLIDQTGKQLGVVSNYQAKLLASDSDLDLVEISPNANPPVCKIMDFGKYRYEQEKKSKEEKAKQVTVKVKEIQFHPNIQMHDYSYRLKQAKEFITEGNKVKACVHYRGREINYVAKGEDILKKLIEDLKELAIVENESFEGKCLSIVLRKI